MSNPYFKFKQFIVYHDKCAMKVGTDGVLIGAWCNTENATNILDIGTGTGLIALMLAQKSNANIVAIDMDENAAIQASENVKRSEWSDRIEIIHTSIQEYAKVSNQKFDLIVSNPPFFVDSLQAPTASRTLARHTSQLSHSELIDNSLNLLSKNGKFCLILPVAEALATIKIASELNLFCHKLVYVYPRFGAEAKRLLIEFGIDNQETVVSELTIETNERHAYTPEFKALCKDYYLKF